VDNRTNNQLNDSNQIIIISFDDWIDDNKDHFDHLK